MCFGCMLVPRLPQKHHARPESRARRQTGTPRLATQALSRRIFGIGSILAPLQWPEQAAGSIAPEKAPLTAGAALVTPTATTSTSAINAPTIESFDLPFTYSPANSDGNTALLRVRTWV